MVYTLTDFLTPPIYDVFNIEMWKFKMNAYHKTLGLHVYLIATKKSNFENDKYIEANTQVIGHLGTHLTKIIFLWLLIVIPHLQYGRIDFS